MGKVAASLYPKHLFSSQCRLRFAPVEIDGSRYGALMEDLDGAVCLTPEECSYGWHFCVDWDYMLIAPDWQEARCCHCFERKYL